MPRTQQSLSRTRNNIGNLILVLGDQLSLQLSSLATGDKARDIVLMVEVQEEATYVRHHKKKIAFLFSAMRHFADELRALGWGSTTEHSIETGRTRQFRLRGRGRRRTARPGAVTVTSPGEWRVLEAMRTWTERARRCRSKSSTTIASSARPPSSTPGPRGASSCAWSISIARCAARPAC